MHPAPDVLCAGILVADHVCTPIDHVPAAGELIRSERLLLTLGGCAGNVAVGLAKMKASVAVAGRVGSDIFGKIVIDMLAEAGLDTSAVAITPNFDTSQTLIVNVKNEDRRFIHTFGANNAFRAADIPATLAGQCKVLYLGGYLVMDALVQEELAPIFASARKAGAKTVLDVVVPGAGSYIPRLDKLLPHVDVFMPNDHEAMLMSNESEPLHQAEFFRSLGAKTVIITQGDKGCVLVGERVKWRAGTYPTEFIDGSGGGDAFAAGYIIGLLNRCDEADCLRIGSALGASCVRAIGTTTGVFAKDECESFMRKNQLTLERL